MAVKSREELINAVKTRLGEAPDDDGVVLLEDLTDTFDDYDSRINLDFTAEREGWESERQDLLNRLDENDRMWRTKYAERFGEGRDTNRTVETTDENVSDSIDETEIKIDDLFE